MWEIIIWLGNVHVIRKRDRFTIMSEAFLIVICSLLKITNQSVTLLLVKFMFLWNLQARHMFSIPKTKGMHTLGRICHLQEKSSQRDKREEIVTKRNLDNWTVHPELSSYVLCKFNTFTHFELVLSYLAKTMTIYFTKNYLFNISRTCESDFNTIWFKHIFDFIFGIVVWNRKEKSNFDCCATWVTIITFHKCY